MTDDRTQQRQLILILVGGLIVRILALLVVPVGYTVPDESGYLQTGMVLFFERRLELFWPPLLGWMVYLLARLGIVGVEKARLVILAMDTLNILWVWLIARRLSGSLGERGRRLLPLLASSFYALYLPAIGYSIFLVSEVPSVFFILLMVLAAASGLPPAAKGFTVGLLVCLTVFDRSNMLPLAFTLPAYFLVRRDSLRLKVRSLAVLYLTFGLALVLGLGGFLARNYLVEGRVTFSDNSAYNLFIGNNEFYQEDLNLFHPWATEEQIKYRREYRTAEDLAAQYGYEYMQAEGMKFIREHPALFARRALGRLARLLAPKTSALELLGGERQSGIFHAGPLLLMALSNVQYALALFGGTLGMALLYRREKTWFYLFLAVVAGAVPLCLIAISKPRYSFPLEPALILAAGYFLLDTRANAAEILGARKLRLVLAAVMLFYAWSWVAWLIFAITSRMAVYQ